MEDIYTTWLNVAAGPRPPDHYALLSVPRFCSDREIIDDAANAQLARLAKRALHPDPKLREICQRLTNEIAKARMTLLSGVQRAAYNGTLEEKSHSTKPPASAFSREALNTDRAQSSAAAEAPAHDDVEPVAEKVSAASAEEHSALDTLASATRAKAPGEYPRLIRRSRTRLWLWLCATHGLVFFLGVWVARSGAGWTALLHNRPQEITAAAKTDAPISPPAAPDPTLDTPALNPSAAVKNNAGNDAPNPADGQSSQSDKSGPVPALGGTIFDFNHGTPKPTPTPAVNAPPASGPILPTLPPELVRNYHPSDAPTPAEATAGTIRVKYSVLLLNEAQGLRPKGYADDVKRLAFRVDGDTLWLKDVMFQQIHDYYAGGGKPPMPTSTDSNALPK